MKCSDCKMTFDEPETICVQEERIGNGSENWIEAEYDFFCPYCGSDCIEEEGRDDEEQEEPPVTCSRVNPVFADMLRMWGMK